MSMPSPWRLLLCPVLIELQHLLLNTNKRVGKISVWQLYNGDLYPFQEICGLLLILFNQLWIFFDALNYLKNRIWQDCIKLYWGTWKRKALYDKHLNHHYQSQFWTQDMYTSKFSVCAQNSGVWLFKWYQSYWNLSDLSLSSWGSRSY